MNQQRLSILLIIALILIIAGFVYWALPHQLNTLFEQVASTTSPAESTSTTKGPAPTTAPTKSAAVYPSIAPKDGMTVSTSEGVIPFTEAFTLKLNASRSCSIVKYALVFGDNTEEDVQVPQDQCTKPYTVVVTHQYQRAGTFTATLSTKPVAGTGIIISQILITANNQSITKGTGTATFTTSPVAGSAPLTVYFSLSAADNENSGVNYTIVFGDGQTATFPKTAAPALSHLYKNPGTFVVTVSKETQCFSGQCSGLSSSIGTITLTVI